MKKLLLVMSAGFVFTAASAQVQFGVKAGANFSTLTGSDVSGAKTLVGFHGGGLVSVPIFSTFTLQPEVLYSMQGAKGTESETDITLHQNYVNVPVLFKYNHASGFFAATGPQIGFLVSAKAKEGGETTDVKSYYKSTDFSWAVAIGYKLPSINAGIDVRYNFGLTNIADYSGADVKNSVFQVGLFYLFGQTKK